MKFLNLTPHTINIVTPEGKPIRNFQPTGNPARVATNPSKDLGLIDGVPSVVDGGFGEVNGLPPYQSGTVIIVSGLVRGKVLDRPDVCSPGSLVRNEKGQPVGASSLVFNKDPRTSSYSKWPPTANTGTSMQYTEEEIKAEIENRMGERKAYPPTPTAAELKDLEGSVRSQMEKGTYKKAQRSNNMSKGIPDTNPGERRLATTKVTPWMTVSSFLVPRLPRERVATVLEVRASVRNPTTRNWCSRTVARIGFDSKAAAIAEARALRSEVKRSKVRTAGKKPPAYRIRHILRTITTAAAVSCVGGAARRPSSTRKRVAQLVRKNADYARLRVEVKDGKLVWSANTTDHHDSGEINSAKDLGSLLRLYPREALSVLSKGGSEVQEAIRNLPDTAEPGFGSVPRQKPSERDMGGYDEYADHRNASSRRQRKARRRR